MVTLPESEYQRMQRMAFAARHAFDVLTDGPNDSDLDDVAGELWRAIEGHPSPLLH